METTGPVEACARIAVPFPVMDSTVSPNGPFFKNKIVNAKFS